MKKNDPRTPPTKPASSPGQTLTKTLPKKATGSSKYDWKVLKQEYATGPWLDYKKFSDAKQVNYNMLRHRALKEKWDDERAKVMQEAGQTAAKKIGETMAKIILEQRGTARLVRRKSVERLQEPLAAMETYEGAARLALDSIKSERLVLGLSTENIQVHTAVTTIVTILSEGAFRVIEQHVTQSDARSIAFDEFKQVIKEAKIAFDRTMSSAPALLASADDKEA